ncbi:hypothetical protein Cni_G03033 [Canna indica]|uniref:BHLH domain-containing protein n=1 Tax=Canna indica TaxID=4628 RepID=A0AAQ3JT44_9LILI|nr:hypothetical protein Cni_G03033 [Canna indica]
MVLEAVVFPQGLISGGGSAVKEEQLYSTGGVAPWRHSLGGEMVVDGMHAKFDASHQGACSPSAAAKNSGGGGRRKRRRRGKSFKNEEEVESQRMTHITVERNRRKQMNDYLAVLQSLIPPSFLQRGDQASIVGGAIDFVKELEQLVQSLEARKRMQQRKIDPHFFSAGGDGVQQPALADVQVSIVESGAILKVLTRRRPKQLLEMLVGLQNLRLTPLHLTVTSIAELAYYSFRLKVEDDCQTISTVDIASAVYEMVGKIQEDD